MLNVITLVGRLTRDPELRRTNSGTAVGAFTVACDEGRKGPDGEKKTLFIDCTVFDKQADTLVKYFRKGNLIGVSGRLTSRKYVNGQGVTVTAYEIVANRIEFVESSSKMDEPKEQPKEAKEEPKQPIFDPEDDSLPF